MRYVMAIALVLCFALIALAANYKTAAPTNRAHESQAKLNASLSSLSETITYIMKSGDKK